MTDYAEDDFDAVDREALNRALQLTLAEDDARPRRTGALDADR